MSREDILARMAALPEPDLTDPDNPEWTEEDFARAKGPESLSAAELAAFPRTAAALRGRQKAPTKAQGTLRLDRAVLEHFKAEGPGWQSRINAVLQAAVQSR